MSPSSVSRLNGYGKIVLTCVVLALGAILVGGTTYWFPSVVLLGVAVLAAVRAMHQDAEPERYPHDREDTLSEREKQRQKELEGEKGRASGESV